MRVAGFVGSPRESGSTDAVVRQVLKGCEEAGAETIVFSIGSMEIHGCRGCMKCRDTGNCVQDDDMSPLYDEIRNSDGLVLGTPIYFFYMTAQLKAFSDRLFTFLKPDFTHRLGAGRKAVLVVTQGAPDPGNFRNQINSMTGAWKLSGINVVDTIVAPGVFKREHVTGNDELMDRAFKAGKALISL